MNRVKVLAVKLTCNEYQKGVKIHQRGIIYFNNLSLALIQKVLKVLEVLELQNTF